ncbi:hypothetical protein PHLGIDRAFT_466278 [Phlebiopsis gigantea 11061_1 CR5-6]|uniref:Uncharacterized protein n=1 Tax=Phlebiopsis gigantea (strain 11061_1 CR5-6) TaxID=745531 RepID=A0A0C3S6K4_PHLG1|nr:hypothetical protein PHLGIDRAFT_466278 [Phlebiopsis gigantea 11061_1 CR5-6]
MTPFVCSTMGPSTKEIPTPHCGMPRIETSFLYLMATALASTSTIGAHGIIRFLLAA